jgi:hypothetical protein
LRGIRSGSKLIESLDMAQTPLESIGDSFHAGAVAPWGTDRLLLWYGESDSAGPVILCASTPSHTAAASRADDVPWFWRFEGMPPRSARDLLSVLGRRPLHFTFWAAAQNR